MDFTNKRILVTGSNGMLGSAIVSIFKHKNIDVIGTDRSIMDITNKELVIQVIKQINPQVIIHCAAYTSVDKAEEDRINCYKVNVDGTRNLAIVAKELGIEFVYFSTDYVFDGTKKEPYEVIDLPNPINYYGLTKYLAEEVIKSLLVKYFIFRISWVFGPNGKNFVNTILRLANERTSIDVVCDQIGSPTFTIDVAKFLSKVQTIDYGLFHLTNEGYYSWYDFACLITEIKSMSTKISPITTNGYKTLAKRPQNSRLKDTLFVGELKKSLREFLK